MFLRGFCLIFIIKLHNEKMFCCRNIILNIMWNSNKEVIKVDRHTFDDFNGIIRFMYGSYGA